MRDVLIFVLVAGVVAFSGIALAIRHRRGEARLQYRRKLELALADGTLTSDELAELEQFRESRDLSHAEVRMIARAIYRAALKHALEDSRLTEQEDQALRKLQLQLALSETDLGDDAERLARLRLLVRVEAHHLPSVDAPIQLVPNETAHWVVQASLADRLDVPGRGRQPLAGIELMVASDAGFLDRGNAVRVETQRADPAGRSGCARHHQSADGLPGSQTHGERSARAARPDRALPGRTPIRGDRWRRAWRCPRRGRGAGRGHRAPGGSPPSQRDSTHHERSVRSVRLTLEAVLPSAA
ncbi:MAG: hypothetical protein L0271_24335 [Gemmatimonadetes bacterium]|nr:hypothetical protein [Gemmatimonadota bacterium]